MKPGDAVWWQKTGRAGKWVRCRVVAVEPDVRWATKLDGTPGARVDVGDLVVLKVPGLTRFRRVSVAAIERSRSYLVQEALF